MRIDLHCHTKKVKTGDAYTRNVTKDKFFQKVIEAEVKIIAITNHNQFDYMQYKEFKDVTEGYCDIWPGVELDIIGKADQKGNCKRGHLIVIANPKNVELFNTQVQELVNDEDVNTFQIGVKKVYETLGKCDCIYIPHFHKEPKLSDEDIQELGELLPDSSRLFKETSDYRSLGVFSNFDYSVIIGSDVQDWNKYETSKFADIRLPVQTFEQFCLLAKKDVQIIDTLLNQKRKKEIPVSPYKKVNFKLPFYEDINIIFGQKGTGKWSVMAALDEGDPLTLVSEAVFARFMSSLVNERERASVQYPSGKVGDMEACITLNTSGIEAVRDALYAAKLISYAQGFSLMRRASERNGWNLDYGTIAKIWRKGCIIRSVFLERITQAFTKSPGLQNLLFDAFFHERMENALPALRGMVVDCVFNGIAAPCFFSALSYFDGLRNFTSAANLIQAQRDYFGAHTYERTDAERGKFFHTDWTGKGGKTVSGTYNV